MLKYLMTDIYKTRLFVQLFRIFEDELLKIFEYIAPIDENFGISGNRIHELHLRICAELENLTKEVCCSISSKNKLNSLIKKERQQTTQLKLKKLGYEDKKLEKLILSELGPETIPFYFKFLNGKLGLFSKKIRFIGGLKEYSSRDSDQFYNPFYVEKNAKTPEWWTNYNKIKHDKIKNYNNCRLKDLINAFGAYFILLNYLVIGYDRYVKTDGILMLNPLKKTHIWNELKSSIFQATSTHINYPIDFYEKFVECRIDEKKLKATDEELTKYNNGILSTLFNSLKPDEYLFYSVLKIFPYVYAKDIEGLPVEQRKNVPKFYKMIPCVSFINKGIPHQNTSIVEKKSAYGSKEYAIDIGQPHDFIGIFTRI